MIETDTQAQLRQAKINGEAAFLLAVSLWTRRVNEAKQMRAVVLIVYLCSSLRYTKLNQNLAQVLACVRSCARSRVCVDLSRICVPHSSLQGAAVLKIFHNKSRNSHTF
jgi:hypothetical protein